MTIAKDFASKLAVAFVAVAMAFSAFASTASAQTTEELQQMINDLLAQVAGLQGQLGSGDAMSSSSVCPYTWTRDLSSGSTGMDVMKLQMFLNSDPDTRVAVEGAGSAGNETEYYGPATAGAVSKFQVKYRSEVLSPANLVNPTGYFGPSSRAKANGLCVAAPAMDDDMMDDDGEMMDEDEDEDEDEDDGELTGEASLEKAEISSADDDELQEGQEDAPVAELEVEFTDGDAEISRIDVRFVGSGDEQDPWDTFDTFSLWVDGDKVAEEAADDEDDYLDEDTGEFRFSGLDIVARDEEDLDIVLAVTVQNSVDGTNDGEDWVVSFDTLRFFDADGVATTETTQDDLGDPGATESFTIEDEGADDELDVRTSTNDPDGTTLPLEDDSDSDWLTIFIFDLDTDDSENDIELNEVPVTVTLSSSTYNTIVDDAELIIDGTTIDDFDVTNGTSSPAVLAFDVDGDVVIDAGDEVQAELRLKFNSLGLGNEGITVEGSVTGANADAIDAEGGDDLSTAQLGGAATGDTHTLRTEGIILDEGEHDFETQGTNDDTGIFEIEFDIEAFEGDFYIAKNATTTGTNTDGGVDFTVTGPGGATLTVSGALSSTADEDTTDVFTVNEGEVETFTLTVTVDTDTTGLHSVQLNEIWFTSNTDGTTSVSSEIPEPLTDFRVVDKNINA